MKQHPALADFAKQHKLACEAWEAADKEIKVCRDLDYLQSKKVLDTVELERSPSIEQAIRHLDHLLRKIKEKTNEKSDRLKALCIGAKDNVKLYFTRDVTKSFDQIVRGIVLTNSTSPSINSTLICVIDPQLCHCVVRCHAQWITDMLIEFAADPVDYIERACVQVGCCCVCNRSLTASREQGIGPVCRQRLGKIIH